MATTSGNAFCESLRCLKLENSILPSHEYLATRLPFLPLESGELSWDLGSWADIQLRRDCSFCQLVVAAISDYASSVKSGPVIKPDQVIAVSLLPGEQSFRLSYPSRNYTRLAFIAEKEEYASGPDNARPIGPPGMLPSRISDWLQTCDKNHDGCSYSSNVPSEPKEESFYDIKEHIESNFRAIDVDLGCIKRISLGERYIALSYVCNLESMPRLGKDNVDLLQTAGSLSTIRPNLPNTIADAINLVKAMGEKYLWVDSLCLIHDDELDMRLGIRIMNTIYQGSYFTIVAAMGSDANAHLPGVESGQRILMPHTTELGGGLKMMAIQNPNWNLSKSVYSERAWTLQEFMLSRRVVIFNGNQVSFRCQVANWGEFSWADKSASCVGRGPKDIHVCYFPDPLDGILPSMSKYIELGEEYSRRALTYEGDAIRAFSGIGRFLCAGMKSSSIEGLPAHYINAFLLFISPSGSLRRRSRFASYSLAGWEGEIMWPQENFIGYGENGEKTQSMSNIIKWLRDKEIAEWSEFRISSRRQPLFKLSQLPDPLEKETNLVELLGQYPHLFLAETAGIQTKFARWYADDIRFDIASWSDELREIEEETTSKKQSKAEFSRLTLDLVNSQAEFDRIVKKMDGGPQGRSIRGWCAGHAYRLRRSQAPNGTARRVAGSRFRLTRDIALAKIDAKGGDRRVPVWKHRAQRRAGEKPNGNPAYPTPEFPPYSVLQTWTICLQLLLGERSSPGIARQPLYSASGKLVGSLHPDNVNLLPTRGSKINLIVVSRGQTPIAGSTLEALEQKPQSGQPWDLLWVIYAVWSGAIAERRGIGQILTSALEDAARAPEVRLILLG